MMLLKNYIGKYIICIFFCFFIIIEINTIIYVLDQLSVLNEIGLVRYHAQRALNCYLLILMGRNNGKKNVMEIHTNCFKSSKQYIDNFNQYNTYGFLYNFYDHIQGYVTNIKNNIDEYLPSHMLHNNKTCFKLDDNTEYLDDKQQFIQIQSKLKENIVNNVTELLDKKVSTLENVYITEFILLFIFSFLTIGYTYIYIKSRTKHNKTKVEKTVINQLCHELRTSLTPIEMYTRELMTSFDTDFEKKQFINNYILTSIKQHKYILTSRLDFEKIMSNKYELNLENVELVKLINSYIKETEQYILLNNKLLKIQLNSQIETLYIRIDKLIFHYIITNILRNSVKYSQTGTINIYILFNSINNVKIQISDEGVGLTEYMITKLNKRKMSIIHNKEVSDSYGLGIRFTKKLVSLLNNGIYYIESNGVGMGSISTITFDTDCADYIYIQERTENISDYVIVCITDDCPIVRNVMKRTIQSIFKDITILQFENGEKMLEYKFDNTHTYIHILDEHMHSTRGELLGHEVSNILKSRNNEQHYTISMSGNELTSTDNSFDIIWNKPPPANDVIENQIREIIRLN